MCDLRLMLFLLLFAVFSVVIVGCENDSGTTTLPGSSVESDYFYTPEIMQFPEDLRYQIDTNNIVFFEETVYFTISYNKIFSMNIDGSNLIELSDYIIKDDAAFITLVTDNTGNLYVIERIYDERLGTDENISIRKLDNKGAEILSVSISEYTAEIVDIIAF